MKGRLNDAKDFFKKAQNCKSDNDERPEINDGLGYSHHALQEYDDALHYYDQALNIDPDNVKFLRHRGQLHFDQQNYAGAIRDLTHAHKIADTDSQVL